MRSLFLQCSPGFDFELSPAYAPDDMMEAPVWSGFHTRDTWCRYAGHETAPSHYVHPALCYTCTRRASYGG